MLRPFVYVAGPISTGGDILGNTNRGISKGHEVWVAGFVPFIPHLSAFHEIVIGTQPWEEWLLYDEQIILRCDALFRMPGASKGADREVAFAGRHGIPVFEDLEEMKRWREAGQWLHNSPSRMGH